MEEVAVKLSEEARGKDTESWVVENDVRSKLLLSISERESLGLGHLSKNGRRNCFSCLIDSDEMNSHPTKECCCGSCLEVELPITHLRSSADWSRGSLAFSGNEETLDGTEHQELSTASSPRLPVLPVVFMNKLRSSNPRLALEK